TIVHPQTTRTHRSYHLRLGSCGMGHGVHAKLCQIMRRYGNRIAHKRSLRDSSGWTVIISLTHIALVFVFVTQACFQSLAQPANEPELFRGYQNWLSSFGLSKFFKATSLRLGDGHASLTLYAATDGQ